MKKIAGIVVITLLLTATAAFCWNRPVSELRIHGNHMIFDSLSEIENYADIIIVGKVEKDFSDFKPTIIYNEQGRYGDFYTITDVKILKTLKGTYNQKEIKVIQPAAFTDKFSSNRELLINEDYNLMKKGSKYLLLLKSTEIENVYSIASINQGKFNIDDSDEKEVEQRKSDTQLKKLENQARNKFKEEFKNN